MLNFSEGRCNSGSVDSRWTRPALKDDDRSFNIMLFQCFWENYKCHRKYQIQNFKPIQQPKKRQNDVLRDNFSMDVVPKATSVTQK